MPLPLDAGYFYSALRPGAEVYAPGCAGHSALFERWLREPNLASARSREVSMLS